MDYFLKVQLYYTRDGKFIPIGQIAKNFSADNQKAAEGEAQAIMQRNRANNTDVPGLKFKAELLTGGEVVWSIDERCA